jgi:hypothetical protein
MRSLRAVIRRRRRDNYMRRFAPAPLNFVTSRPKKLSVKSDGKTRACRDAERLRSHTRHVGDAAKCRVIESVVEAMQRDGERRRFFGVVRVVGLEPTTSCSQGRCATRLRYTLCCGRYCTGVLERARPRVTLQCALFPGAPNGSHDDVAHAGDGAGLRRTGAHGCPRHPA